MTNVPSTHKLLSRCRLPLGLLMHPFRDLSSLHMINSNVIVRCRSCRTYINPFVQFIDSGRRWRCPVCHLTNSVPDDFFYDPASQSYGDPARRPEIRSATVEFIAPQEYMLRPPIPAFYVFCFEVNVAAISTGYLNLACDRISAQLDRIPGDSRRQIAFITFDSGLHFYKLFGGSMQMLICRDLEEVFLPCNEGLINRIEGNEEAIREFLQRLPRVFANTYDTGNCLGFAIQTCLKLAGGTGGRVSIFYTSLPNVEPGKLVSREDTTRPTPLDAKHLGPATDFYKTLSLECAAQQLITSA
ncbi:unnamed protein product [Protopolystoma xenopodis]|uniref:Sec23/Sec24 trunk domain-containing protein n=1 Tax=Protopolystoma xenopodis TaxID=117903 RepID=A0A448XK50_9PLAT|nr:unnamed protein product [Protopolystoma xenopodis]